MESSLISVSKIFTEKLLRIPDYQRGYAWTTKEITDFWNDLMFLEKGKNHYVGVLTLEDVPEKNKALWQEDHWIIDSKNYHPFYIVDGQQRITTIIILIQSIIEEIEARDGDIQLNYTDITDIRKKFIYENKSRTPSRSYIFGYDKDNPSYEYLKRSIFNEESPNSFKLENTIYTQNLSNAKKFFSEKIKELDIECIESIYTKITQNMLFNIYSLDEEIDTYVAFETMNNRGKVLSHLELLKNRLIYLTTKLDDEDFHKTTLRHAINECWKSMYHYLGKDTKNRLDDDEFLYHHYILYFKTLPKTKTNDEEKKLNIFEIEIPVNQYDDYDEYQYRFVTKVQPHYKNILLDDIFSAKPIKDITRNHTVNSELINNYVISLKKCVETWFYIHNPLESDYSIEVKEWLSKINRIPDWTSTRILLLEAINKSTPIDEQVDFLKSLERSLFVFTTLERFSFRHLSFIPLALLLKENKKISQVTNNLKTTIDRIIKSESIPFNSKFNDGDFYNWMGIRYFMYEYEYHLYSKSNSSRVKLNWEEFKAREQDSDYYSIEHIYPQKARAQSWTELFSNCNAKQKKQLKHAIGNLVPLSRKKNSSLSNKAFSSKVEGYRTGCYSEIEVASNDTWGPEQIINRSLQLIEFIDNRWQMGLCPQSIPKEKKKKYYLTLLGLDF
ncbi:DUF262 domain-containing protein [Serratia marcescens]